MRKKRFIIYGIDPNTEYPRALEVIEAKDEVGAEMLFFNKRPNIHMRYTEFYILEEV